MQSALASAAAARPAGVELDLQVFLYAFAPTLAGGLTAAVPVENPYCSCKLKAKPPRVHPQRAARTGWGCGRGKYSPSSPVRRTAHSCSPYGEFLLQL